MHFIKHIKHEALNIVISHIKLVQIFYIGGGVSGLHALFRKESLIGEEKDSSQESNGDRGDCEVKEFGTLQDDTVTLGTLGATPSDGYDGFDRMYGTEQLWLVGMLPM